MVACSGGDPAIVALLLHVSTVVSAQSPATSAPLAGQAPAPARVVTLDDALALAEARNEQIAIAEAGVRKAGAGQDRVRSEKYPQLGGSASLYDRTLQSEFEGIFDSGSGR